MTRWWGSSALRRRVTWVSVLAAVAVIILLAMMNAATAT